MECIQGTTINCILCELSHVIKHQKKILIINLSISGKLEIWKKNIFTGNLISSKPYLISGKLGIISGKQYYFLNLH